MKLEHFISGLFSEIGYKTVYSSKVKELLPKESLMKLLNLGLKKDEANDVVTMHFPSEGVVTRSYIQKTNDVYGRNGWINHTVIMKTDDFLKVHPEVLDVAFNQVQEPFNVRSITADTKQLDVISVGVDSRRENDVDD